MSFVERCIILCPYLGESTIIGSTVHTIGVESYAVVLVMLLCFQELKGARPTFLLAENSNAMQKTVGKSSKLFNVSFISWSD